MHNAGSGDFYLQNIAKADKLSWWKISEQNVPEI